MRAGRPRVVMGAPTWFAITVALPLPAGASRVHIGNEVGMYVRTSYGPHQVNPLQAKHFRLLTLGRFALVSASGDEESLSRRRRKLALLCVLALASRPYSRDVLADLFWGEEDDERARHSLSDALSHLRRLLGREAIATRCANVE